MLTVPSAALKRHRLIAGQYLHPFLFARSFTYVPSAFAGCPISWMLARVIKTYRERHSTVFSSSITGICSNWSRPLWRRNFRSLR